MSSRVVSDRIFMINDSNWIDTFKNSFLTVGYFLIFYTVMVVPLFVFKKKNNFFASFCLSIVKITLLFLLSLIIVF